MLSNSVKSLLFHTALSVVTVIVAFLSSLKIPIELGLVNVFIYFLVGKYFLKRLENPIKEVISLAPTFIIGAFLFLILYSIQLNNGVAEVKWTIMSIYLVSLGPSMLMLGEALSVRSISYFYLPFSLLPSLLMWLGLQSKKREKKSHQMD
jgi:hypothetical protein